MDLNRGKILYTMHTTSVILVLFIYNYSIHSYFELAFIFYVFIFFSFSHVIRFCHFISVFYIYFY